MADPRQRADDDVLIAGALRGDEEALGRLLAQDQEWAYNIAYRVLGQEADARDAVQEAFLHAIRALRGDGSPPRRVDSFKPWLRRVVSNAAISQIRRRPSATIVPVDDLTESLPGPAQREPGRSIEQQETRVQVLQALLSLPATQRVALALREVLDASYDEIADALDLPRTAVGTLLFRARAGFRAAYDRVAEAAPPIDCPDLVPLFAAIVDDQPRPAAWQTLEAHLQTCSRCQGEVESQRRARRAYALIPLLALPAGWDPAQAALASASTGAAAGATTLAGAGADAATGGTPASANGLAGQTAGAGASASPAGAAGTGAAAVAASSASGGLLAGLSGVQLTLATLATVAAVGTAVVVGPFGDPGTGPDAAPTPSAALLGSPAPSPGLAAAAEAGGSSGAVASTAALAATTSGSPGPGPSPQSSAAAGPGEVSTGEVSTPPAPQSLPATPIPVTPVTGTTVPPAPSPTADTQSPSGSPSPFPTTPP